MSEVIERCPWCESIISRSKFVQIETKIREQEQVKTAELEKHLRQQMQVKSDAEIARQRKLIEANAAAQIAKELAAGNVEREQLAASLKAAGARESALKESMRRQIDTGVQAKVKEIDAKRQKDLDDQRASLQKDKDDTVLKLQGEFSRERGQWQSKFKAMERQLQKKTAQDLGDGAEIDLYELLKETFPEDRLRRIQKGQSGADIHHQVMYKGQPCGKIVIDSKNRQAWQHAFITKLRQDQTQAGAEHAILSTTVFPSGKKELCIEADVIVASPPRVPHIISLLRRSMITIHVKGLSLSERTSKMSKLYKLITSERYGQRFRELEKLTGDVLDLDVQEKKAHDNVWKKRGTIAMRLANALREIEAEVASVIEAQDHTELPVAS